jgi:hypothetical protein
MARPRQGAKESEIRNFPPEFRFPLLTRFFVETGMMPTSKGKKKKSYIIVNLAGIALLRPQSGGHSFKVSNFASIYDIIEIIQTDPKRRDIKTRWDSFWFQCEHCDEAVAWILAARESIDSSAVPITLTNFPSRPPAVSPDLLPGAKNIAQMRYVCTCYRYSHYPPSEPFIRYFGNLDPKFQRTIFLDTSYEPPFNLKCLLVPLLEADHFTALHLRGFAPHVAFRLAHHLLKHSKVMRSVAFEGYQFLIPAQLRLENLKYRSDECLSLSFQKCQLDESRFTQLIEALSKFKGCYQRLSFSGAALTGPLTKTFFSTLKRARCCCTLEQLEIDGVDSGNCPADAIAKAIVGTFRKLRCIESFSISGWAPPLKLEMMSFSGAHALTELFVRAQDLSPVMSEFELPPALRLADFPRCTFPCVALSRSTASRSR